MLQITVPGTELFNERTQEFIQTKSQVLSLEHSLMSISKWESKWHKPFLNKETKTQEEIIDYIKCMTITPNVDEIVYNCLSKENIAKIKDYIEDKMTATWFNERNVGRRSNEEVTSELIYYWMISYEIPFQCEKWHLNRLLTLIKICSIKNKNNGKKNNYSKKDIMRQNAALNAARREKYGTSG